MSKLNPNAQPFDPSLAAARSQLNPNARPFNVTSAGVAQRAAEREERSLFMTFSTGSPLSKGEIHRYFTRSFGQCVECVYLQNLPPRDPEFGRITFISRNLPEIIMLDNEVVKICINHKPIWLKKYVPRSQRKPVAQTS